MSRRSPYSRRRLRIPKTGFDIVQLQVDKNGNGVGKASIYTKITATDDHTIELENFANEPVMLNDVKKVK